MILSDRLLYLCSDNAPVLLKRNGFSIIFSIGLPIVGQRLVHHFGISNLIPCSTKAETWAHKLFTQHPRYALLAQGQGHIIKFVTRVVAGATQKCDFVSHISFGLSIN